MTRRVVEVALGILILLLDGCVHPHENFKNIMQGTVGRSFDDYAIRAIYPREMYEGTRSLANGNIEYAYKGIRTCRYFAEVDKSTRKIVAWRFEANPPEDCQINP